MGEQGSVSGKEFSCCSCSLPDLIPGVLKPVEMAARGSVVDRKQAHRRWSSNECCCSSFQSPFKWSYEETASDMPAMWTGSSAASRSMTRSHSVSLGDAGGGGDIASTATRKVAFRELFSANEASSEEQLVPLMLLVLSRV